MSRPHDAPAPGGWAAALRSDLPASIVVFLVALPLCMGVAIASGAPPAAGLLTGIIGGLVVGFLAGSPLQVSGPAAGLAVIVWELIQRFGLPALGLVVLLAGLMQLAAGAMRLGQWFRAVSPAVIHGMLAGIGVLIFVGQFHVMVDDKPKGSGLRNLLAIPEAVVRGVLPGDGTAHHLAAQIGVLTIATIVVWMRFAPKRLKVVPAPLVAVAVAMVAAAVAGLPVRYVSVPGNLLDAVQLPTLDVLRGSLSWSMVAAAASLAVVASAETLLCATAVDQKHNGPRTNYDRELVAQGVGNMLCGLVGALPMTGVIVRSSANVEAGARTRMSAILHGAWILAFVVALPAVLGLIPVSALAAVLVFTGYKLVNPAALRSLWQQGRAEFAIYLATLVGIVVTDLLTGVMIGLALSLVKLVYTFTHLHAALEPAPVGAGHVLRLAGTATFVRLPQLAAALGQVPAGSDVEICAERLAYVDHACLGLLMDWERQHLATGGTVRLAKDRLDALSRAPRPILAVTRGGATAAPAAA